MGKSAVFANEFLLHIFNNEPIPGIGDLSGLPAAATAGDLHVALHQGPPGQTGDQTVNECGYAGYARIAVARTPAGWTVTDNQVSPTSDILFATVPADTQDAATHFSIGTDSTGVGKVLFSGRLSIPEALLSGVTPRIDTSSVLVER